MCVHRSSFRLWGWNVPLEVYGRYFAKWLGTGEYLLNLINVATEEKLTLPALVFTPKRPATRGTGQAGTQRAAEHASLPTYPTTPVALDRCRVFLRFSLLPFEAD